MGAPESEAECYLKYNDTPTHGACPAAWDSLFCWPPTPAGGRMAYPCSTIFPFLFDDATTSDAVAFRSCTENGKWALGGWTNYTECERLDVQELEMHGTNRVAISAVIFSGSLLSLISLCIALALFSCFRSLQCSRIRVHRQLVVSLIVHTLLMMALSAAGLWDNAARLITHTGWLCKVVVAGKVYSGMSSIYWMFVEGLLLHSSIAVSVFERHTPFHLYYATGWGIPLLCLCIWLLLMEFRWKGNGACWEGYGRSPIVWLITGPMIVALLVNGVFLVNIIRILISKMRTNHGIETKQLMRAMRATALLFPLLGLSHLLFCINPGGEWESFYMMLNAILQSSQGLFVSVLYCFLNSEVQSAISAAYTRRRSIHFGSTRHRPSRLITSFTSTLTTPEHQRETSLDN